jgi:hypothetical protein
MIFLYSYGFILLFWVFYVAAINIAECWSSIALWWKLVIWPIPLVMLGVFDIPFQIIGATVIFWDFPKEWTFTSRLARYKNGPPGIRKWVATRICTDSLNFFAPSKKHC